ncbi:MAG TPA: hypothetical protein VF804_14755 [Holophagaceae bacterium]
MDLDAPPTTIHAQEGLLPRGPWSFLKAALPGGFSRWGWGLLAGWALMVAGPAFSWAMLLRRTAGWSALPGHWGEGITARDIWELWENGGLKHAPVNSPAVHTLGLGLVIVLWCGWRMQTEILGLPGRLGPWLLGALDTLLVGLVPLGLVAWAVLRVLGWLGDTGIQGLGWTAFVGRPLVVMATLSALGLQWWFLRLGRTERAVSGHRGYGRHLGWSFQSLWAHPVQWTVVVLGGTALRAILSFLVLLLAWRIGGATVGRVWTFFLLQVAATVVNAWLLGWFLRASALYWQHDLKVREARADFVKAHRDADSLDA